MNTTGDTKLTGRQSPVPTMRPPVDIFEDDHGITLLADICGVNKDSLEIHVDGENLTLEGDTRIKLPEGLQTVHADVSAARYHRSFSLSGELDTAAIEANLNEGVLKLRIPKRAEIRPRRIEISA